MKILFSAYHNPHFTTITEYWESAIIEEGHTLESFDDRKFIIPGRIRDRVPFLQTFDLNRLNKKLISHAKQFIPDIIIIQGGYRTTADTINAIKKLGCTTVLYTTDPPIGFESILSIAPLFDFVFCSGTEHIELLNQHGYTKGILLPYACDPSLHKPAELSLKDISQYTCDVAFVGTAYPERIATLTALSHLNLGIWGPGWDSIPEGHPLKKHVRGNTLIPSEWSKAYSAATITLVTHFAQSGIACHQASPKVFEALACKAFVLMDNQRDPLALFTNNNHLCSFNNTDDLRQKAEYFLEHPEKRQRIADAGHTLVLEKHTYQHRIKQLIETIS